MKRKSVVSLIAIVAIVTAVIFAGCTESYTKIRDILDDPEGYDGKKVTVAGRAYRVMFSDDIYVSGGTGDISIDSEDFDGRLPQERNRIKVTGIVRHTEGRKPSIELESWKYRD